MTMQAFLSSNFYTTTKKGQSKEKLTVRKTPASYIFSQPQSHGMQQIFLGNTEKAWDCRLGVQCHMQKRERQTEDSFFMTIEKLMQRVWDPWMNVI